MTGRDLHNPPKSELVNPYAWNGDWQHGDLLLFSGRHCLSWTIRVGTCSHFSHVAGVAEITRAHIWEAIEGKWLTGLPREKAEELARGFRPGWLLFESTTLVDSPCRITGQRIKGVQAHRPMSRIARYRGEVWLLRLHEDYRLAGEERRKLALGYLSEIGTKYDGRGAFTAGTRLIKRSWYLNRADMSSLFCSEMIARRLQVIGRLPIANPARYSPKSLYRALVGSGVYLPPRRIYTGRERQ
jgi:hypothetical protein